MQKISSILQKKTYFFLFYTITFTKHPHQFIYYTHFFIKIKFSLNFFIISHLTLLFPLNTPPSSSHNPYLYLRLSVFSFFFFFFLFFFLRIFFLPLLRQHITTTIIITTRSTNHSRSNQPKIRNPPNPKPTDQTTRNQWVDWWQFDQASCSSGLILIS